MWDLILNFQTLGIKIKYLINFYLQNNFQTNMIFTNVVKNQTSTA